MTSAARIGILAFKDISCAGNALVSVLEKQSKCSSCRTESGVLLKTDIGGGEGSQGKDTISLLRVDSTESPAKAALLALEDIEKLGLDFLVIVGTIHFQPSKSFSKQKLDSRRVGIFSFQDISELRIVDAFLVNFINFIQVSPILQKTNLILADGRKPSQGKLDMSLVKKLSQTLVRELKLHEIVTKEIENALSIQEICNLDLENISISSKSKNSSREFSSMFG